MSKRSAALAGALCALLLASCGSRERTPGDNAAAAPEVNANGAGTEAPADPAAPGMAADGSADAVPPPDAVSHPDGYLPPAPAEPDPASANSSGSDPSPPATEDEYLRNRQAGR